MQLLIATSPPCPALPRRALPRHVELDGGIEFPFSRGVSFYEVDSEGRIVFARDIVEPAMKPGGAALKVGRGGGLQMAG